MECIRVGLGEKDSSGRRRPITIPGSEFVVNADRIFAAVGQEIDHDFIPDDQRANLIDGWRLAVDSHTAMTKLDGVFAAGDMVTGPATVIKAINAGHQAAESIRHFLEEGRPDIREQRPELKAPIEYELPDNPPVKAQRIHQETIVPEPGKEFAEVEQGYNAKDAVAEARRCLRCGPCGECHICATTCQRRHIFIRAGKEVSPGSTAVVRTPANVSMSFKASKATEGFLLESPQAGIIPHLDRTDETHVDVYPLRTYIVEELCRGCGSCVEVCPFHALSLDETLPLPKAKVAPAFCRGCNLCKGVCPTNAVMASSLSPDWWGARVEDAFATAKAQTPQAEPYVVLACQRRAGSMELVIDREGIHVEAIRFRCVGQINSAMLLDLLRHGARRILIAGCSPERCRFGSGAIHAAETVERAYAVMKLLGWNKDRIIVDWSSGRAFDRLEESVEKLISK
ncbi:hydrogenase iron-sulfur subunit [Acidobacteriota bacterium]